MWSRGRLARRPGAGVVLVLLASVGRGVCVAGVAAARRTESAYRRFVAGAHADDVGVGMPSLGGDSFVAAVEALPQVVEHARRSYAFVVPLRHGVPDPNGPGQPLVSDDGRFTTTMDRGRVVAGRAARPDRADEAT